MAHSSTATPKSADPAELRRALDMMDFFAGMVEAATLPRGVAVGEAAAIPVVIIAGFLGAGKTTLLRHMLSAPHGRKIAALVNDFAALNIDAALVADVSNDTTALENGCICCSLSGSVARSIAEIANRETPVDAIVIEASGVSDPWAIAQIAQTVAGVSLDCVVAVVDADLPTADAVLARQVCVANIVLLNKVDLVSRAAADAAEIRLRSMAPGAQVLRTTHCAIPAALLFDGFPVRDVADRQATSGPRDAFATLVLRPSSPVDRAALADWLKNLPDGVLRVKGFLTLSDAPDTPTLLQAVGRRWALSAAPDQSAKPGLVVIGQTGALQQGQVARWIAALGLIEGQS